VIYQRPDLEVAERDLAIPGEEEEPVAFRIPIPAQERSPPVNLHIDNIFLDNDIQCKRPIEVSHGYRFTIASSGVTG
jgi:hypothetical protein